MPRLSPEAWAQIDALCARALELPPPERDGFLVRAAAGDAELLREARALLESCLAAEDGLADSATALAPSFLRELSDEREGDATPVAPGARIGPYRVIGEIARGGMGVVYLAERADEQFEQRVALKLVKRGMDSDEVLRRFRAERQILAALEHPNIARLYDGGAADDGRPYLVMEYVNGVPIDDHCEAEHLGLEQRLALFTTVCAAVQHAHRNLVVHRDLKPGNVLVSATGDVKLLDFGIAKLLDASGDELTPETRTGLRVLTPEYAAPEQLRGDPATTATDVWALGVLLHRLLTGRAPTATEDGAPVRPSLAARPEWRRRLRGDLDTLVRKALEPDPSRRYASAQHLLEDLERYRARLPILARPPGLIYRAGKYVRRHRVGVAATAAALLALLVSSGLWVVRVTQERNHALTEAEKARQVAAFMEGMFAAADPFAPRQERVDTLRVRDFVARGATRLREEEDSPPLVRAQMLNVLGRVHSRLGLSEGAAELLEEALALRLAELGPLHTDVAETLNILGTVRTDQGDFETAERLLRQALDARVALHGPDAADVAPTLSNLGLVLGYVGRLDEAESAHRAALRISRSVHDSAHLSVAMDLSNLASLLLRRGEAREAEQLLRESVAMRRQLLGPEHPSVGVGLNNLAAVLRTLDELDEAEEAIREALEIARAALGPEHPNVATSMSVKASILRNQGRYAPAESLFLQVLELNRRNYGEIHVNNAITLEGYVLLLRARGELDEAERRQGEALSIAQRIFGDEHLRPARATLTLAEIVQEKGEPARAAELYRRGIAALDRLVPPDDANLASARVQLAGCLTELGRYAEAEAVLLNAYRVLGSAGDPRDEATRETLEALVTLYADWGAPERGAEYAALLSAHR